MNELIVILDFGSQYTQLIARRLRELNVYCEIYPYHKMPDRSGIKAVILSGSPFSVLDEDALKFDISTVLGKYPLLGVCYGAQLIAHHLGGKVLKSDKREYGKAIMTTAQNDIVFTGVTDQTQVWMSHGDSIEYVPDQFEVIAKTSDIIAAYKSKPGAYAHPVYCLQFHPEVTHSLQGKDILYSFVHNVAGCACNWTAASMVRETVSRLSNELGEDHVMMGLSGGVDSTVAAFLIHKAIGKRLHCIFVDNGLLRKNEFEEVLHSYEGMGFNIKGVKAADIFLDQLKGVSDPEAKRKVIGRLFIETFESEARHMPDVKWLGQGTIYPDVIESISVHGPSVTIKSHHNVGGLPDILKLKLVEPLRMLFKDEVRRVGKELG
ncbi:MAG: glutamine-hydrolyzing GMP synthase, partial [Saprospiraceae bacterium]